MVLAVKTSAQGHQVVAVARAFWPRRSSSNRRGWAHGIDQQPVLPCRPKSANMLEMPDFIGCLRSFAFGSKWATQHQIIWKSVLSGTARYRVLKIRIEEAARQRIWRVSS
jgi:hypothetical protein